MATTSDAALRNMMSRHMGSQPAPPMVDNLINSIVEHGAAGSGGGGPTSLDTLDAALLEEFKQQVKLWCELDTAIKRLQNAIRERKKAQNVMKTKILDFMQRYRVEDLNTRDGVVRYKTAYVKAPLSQRNIRDKLTEYFTNDPAALGIIRKVFEEREQVEKVSLRRITNGNGGYQG